MIRIKKTICFAFFCSSVCGSTASLLTATFAARLALLGKVVLLPDMLGQSEVRGHPQAIISVVCLDQLKGLVKHHCMLGILNTEVVKKVIQNAEQ